MFCVFCQAKSFLERQNQPTDEPAPNDAAFQQRVDETQQRATRAQNQRADFLSRMRRVEEEALQHLEVRAFGRRPLPLTLYVTNVAVLGTWLCVLLLLHRI